MQITLSGQGSLVITLEQTVGISNFLVLGLDDHIALQIHDAVQAVAAHLDVVAGIAHGIKEQVVLDHIALQIDQAVRLINVAHGAADLIGSQGAAGSEGPLLGGVVENALLVHLGELRGGEILADVDNGEILVHIETGTIGLLDVEVIAGVAHVGVIGLVLLAAQGADDLTLVQQVSAGEQVVDILVLVVTVVEIFTRGNLQHDTQRPVVAVIIDIIIVRAGQLAAVRTQQALVIQAAAAVFVVQALLADVQIAIPAREDVALGVRHVVAVAVVAVRIAVGLIRQGDVAVRSGGALHLHFCQGSGCQQHQGSQENQ